MLLSRLSVVVIKKSGTMLYQQLFMGKKIYYKATFPGVGWEQLHVYVATVRGRGSRKRVLYNLGHNQSTIYIHYVSMKIVKFLISLLISIMINQKHVSVTYSFLQKLKIQIEKKTSRIYYLLNLKCLKISMLKHKFNEM